MKNYNTRYFCRISGACTAGMRFALNFKTMRECYTALLAGSATRSERIDDGETD